jgi:hypothetical protein
MMFGMPKSAAWVTHPAISSSAGWRSRTDPMNPQWRQPTVQISVTLTRILV